MKLLQRTTVGLAAVAALAAVPMQEAHADLRPTVGSPVVTPLGGGLFRWDYVVTLSSSQNPLLGRFFVIYDFGPSAQPVLVPAGWTYSSEANSHASAAHAKKSITPAQASALNLMFSWAGMLPTTNSMANSAFTEREVDVGLVPSPTLLTTQVPTAAPEPASLVLLGTGMLGIVGFARRRNSK